MVKQFVLSKKFKFSKTSLKLYFQRALAASFQQSPIESREREQMVSIRLKLRTDSLDIRKVFDSPVNPRKFP